MKCLIIPMQLKIALVALLTFFQVFPPTTYAKSAVKLQQWEGTIEYSPDGPSPFQLEGNASHLGQFQAYGEMAFLPPEEDGALVGDGVVVFEAANGDLLVGTVSAEADEEGRGELAFHWRDTIEFSDGTVYESTGRFADAANRPPGLVVIAIIAVLIGLLLPAAQKCSGGDPCL